MIRRRTEKLRALHVEMDRAVLNAYGWNDIAVEPVFEPEWADEDGDGPIRYRWPEEIRDLVLARLLELNEDRAKDEVRRGVTAVYSSRNSTAPEDFELEIEE
jgi:hypothetical protein